MTYRASLQLVSIHSTVYLLKFVRIFSDMINSPNFWENSHWRAFFMIAFICLAQDRPSELLTSRTAFSLYLGTQDHKLHSSSNRLKIFLNYPYNWSLEIEWERHSAIPSQVTSVHACVRPSTENRFHSAIRFPVFRYHAGSLMAGASNASPIAMKVPEVHRGPFLQGVCISW